MAADASIGIERETEVSIGNTEDAEENGGLGGFWF
jgi:hypothetical protein